MLHLYAKMLARFALLAAVLSAVLSACPGAALTPTLSSFFGTYMNVNSLSGASYANSTVSGHSYSIVSVNSSSTIIVNTSGAKYSFVLNSTTAAAVLGPYYLALYVPSSSVLQSLNSSIRSFQSSSQASLNDCFIETGLQSYLCNSGDSLNTCMQKSCQSVPVCNKVLNKFGVPSSFADGIYNFSVQYYELNGSYRQFYSALSKINSTNYGAQMAALQSIEGNISHISSTMYENPIFPAPSSYSINYISSVCNQYGSFGGPWYCYAVGFCFPPSFNSTKLSNVNSAISNVLSNPVTSSSIGAKASADVSAAEALYEPVVGKALTAQFNTMINQTQARYTSLVANLTFLSERFSNASLETGLGDLVNGYQSVKGKGTNQNLSYAANQLGMLIDNASALYTRVSSQYLPAYNLAYNNSALILAKELDFQGTPPQPLTALAFQQAKLNQELNSKLNYSQLSGLQTQLQAVHTQAVGMGSPLSLGGLMQSSYGGLLSSLLGTGAALQSSESSAPAYAAAIAIAEGLVVMAIIYLATYFRLKRKHRLKFTPSVRRAWRNLFILVFILVLVYAGATYSVAQGASTFLPLEQYVSGMRSAGYAYVLVNNTIASNTSVQQCVAALKSAAASSGLTLYVLNFTQAYSCRLNSTVSGVQCSSKIVGSYYPTIVIDNSSGSSLVYHGLYGRVLYASGSAAEGAACPLGVAVRAG